MAISQCAPGMPQTVSTNSPSTDPVPSTSRPSPTKNAVAESRSVTVIPMWSKRRTCAMGSILQLPSCRFDIGTEPWLGSRHVLAAGRRSPRDPLNTSRVLTPNEMYSASLVIAGYVPSRSRLEDYIALQPVKLHTINYLRVKINHRVYDCEELNPYRGQPSTVAEHKNKWSVHHDPYDLTRVWIRNHHDIRTSRGRRRGRCRRGFRVPSRRACCRRGSCDAGRAPRHRRRRGRRRRPGTRRPG